MEENTNVFEDLLIFVETATESARVKDSPYVGLLLKRRRRRSWAMLQPGASSSSPITCRGPKSAAITVLTQKSHAQRGNQFSVGRFLEVHGPPRTRSPENSVPEDRVELAGQKARAQRTARVVSPGPSELLTPTGHRTLEQHVNLRNLTPDTPPCHPKAGQPARSRLCSKEGVSAPFTTASQLNNH